jgi:hypothetical protein
MGAGKQCAVPVVSAHVNCFYVGEGGSSVQQCACLPVLVAEQHLSDVHTCGVAASRGIHSTTLACGSCMHCGCNQQCLNMFCHLCAVV